MTLKKKMLSVKAIVFIIIYNLMTRHRMVTSVSLRKIYIIILFIECAAKSRGYW